MMKKRILSFLLLLCMLVTMVPVSAMAAETGNAGNSEPATDADYAKLYVQEGLVSAYMAYGNGGGTLVLNSAPDAANGTIGTWYDLVGDNHAIVRGQGKNDETPWGWYIDSMGGFAYDDLTGAATGMGITFEDLNTDFNKLDEHTIEYVGKALWRDDAEAGQAFKNSAFQLGTWSINVWTNLKGANEWGNGYVWYRTYIGRAHYGSECDRYTDTGKGWSDYDKYENEIGKKVVTWTTDRAKVVDGETVSYVHSFAFGDKYVKKNIQVPTDLNSEFFRILYDIPGAAYALRVYDRVLTVAEKNYNHLIDIFAASHTPIEAIEALSDSDIEALANLYANKEVKDYGAELSDTIAKEVQTGKYAAMYVQDGLTGLFTAFDPEDPTVSVATRTWTNRVMGGTNAKLWKENDTRPDLNNNYFKWVAYGNGGFGFDGVYGVVDQTGDEPVFNAFQTVNGAWHNNLPLKRNGGDDFVDYYRYRLDFGINALPEADYTVELLMKYKPFYAIDSVTGKPVAPATDYVEMPGGQEGMEPELAMGLFYVKPIVRGQYGVGQWGTEGWAAGSNNYSSLPGDRKNGRYFNQILTYTYTRDEGVAGEDGNITATYKVYFDTSVYYEKTATGTQFAGADTGSFYVGQASPATYYAARIYNRVLTSAERTQNRLADIAAYYRLDVPSDLSLSKLNKAIGGASFVEGDAYGETQQNLQDAIDLAALPEVTDLYVQDGLTSLYLAYKSSSTVDLANGKWNNLVFGVGASTFKGTWKTYANGGVGYEKSFGLAVATGDGRYTYDSSSMADTAGRSLTLPGELILTDDYTVEYAYTSKDYIVVDANGNKVANYDDVVVSDGNGGYKRAPGTNSNGGQVQIGILGAFTTPYGNVNGESPSVRWFLGTGWYGEAWQGAGNWFSDSSGTALDTFVWTLTVAKASVTGDDKNTPEAETDAAGIQRTYTMYDNGTKIVDRVFSSLNNSGKNWSNYCPADISGYTTFKLFGVNPVTVYAVRTYNRVLSPEEMAQNRAVDAILFYDLELTEEAYTEEGLAKVITALCNFSLDADNYDEMQDKAEEALVKAFMKTPYDLYVKDGLTGLFTAFDPEDPTLSIANRTWSNRVVGGTNATLSIGPSSYNGSNFSKLYTWKSYANGGFGYEGYYGMINADGTASTTNTSSNKNNYPGNHLYKEFKLSFDIGLIPAEDYTFEYVAEYKPFYTVDANGNPVGAAQDYLSLPGGMYNNSYGPTDQIGLANIVVAKRGQGAWTRWRAGTAKVGWDDHGFGYGNTITDRPLEKIVTYTITRDETPTDDTVAAHYKLMYDGTEVLNTTVTSANFIGAEQGSFYLAAATPITFYAARMYDRVLSTAERNRNHLADLFLHYGIEPEQSFYKDAAGIAALAEMFAATSLSNDPAAKATIEMRMGLLLGGQNDIADTFYVQDGLVGLFTAFKGEAGVSIGGGFWTNRVDGSVATFKGNLWTKYEQGVGYDMVAGLGTKVTDYFGNEYVTVDTSKKNNMGAAASLELPFELIDSADYTVEFALEYKDYLVVDEGGNKIADYRDASVVNKYLYKRTSLADGTVDTISSDTALTDDAEYTYALLGNTYKTVVGVHTEKIEASDRIGHLTKYATRLGTQWGKAPGGGWYLTKAGEGWYGNYSNNLSGGNGNGWAGDFSGSDLDIYVWTLTRDEEADSKLDEETGANLTGKKATYSIYDNAALVTDLDGAFSTLNTSSHVYWQDDYAVFKVFQQSPVTVYAIRVYNRVLTEAEMTQNLAADLIEYFDLDTTKLKTLDADAQAKVFDLLADFDFNSDKAELQAILDSTDFVDGKTVYDKIYVENGLVGLYTAFGATDMSLNLNAAKWYNKVNAEEYATLRGAMSYWKRSDNGFGYSMTRDQYDAAGVSAVGIDLPDAYGSLAQYTVETVAAGKGITNADGTRFNTTWKPASKDENGVEIPAQGHQWGITAGARSVFRFGLLNAYGFVSLKLGVLSGESMAMAWGVSPYPYDQYSWNGDDNDVISMARENGFALANPSSIYVPVVTTMKATKSVSDAGVIDYAVAYGNAAPLASLTLDPTDVDDNANNWTNWEKYEYLSAMGLGNDPHWFSLFNKFPSDVYAIRVYDRVLTQAERLQNAFADKAAFYGLDITGYDELSDDAKAALYAGFEAVDFDDTKTFAQGMYDFYTGKNVKFAETVLEFETFRPVTSGTNGYRAVFTLSQTTLDLFKAAGYTVYYGAVLGLASVNTFDSLKVAYDGDKIITSADNAQVVVVEGPDGTGVYYDIASGDGIKRISAAVTAKADARFLTEDVLIRGFAILTDGKNQSVVYDNASLAGTSLANGGSIADVANYYVNEFEGNVADMYAYMSNAYLLETLAVAGIEARTNVGADLVLYVDAANGADTNNGLTAGAALKTVGAAYAAAKIHLGREGVKGVTIQLAAGTYYVDETLSLTADDVAASAYYFKLCGAGDTTVLTTEKLVSSEVKTDEATGYQYVQLEQVNGEYPDFRYVYGDGKLLTMAHAGGDSEAESYWNISGVRTEGEYVVFTISANDTLGSIFWGEEYDGAELHITGEWNSKQFDIYDVKACDDGSSYDVYVNAAAALKMGCYGSDDGTINGFIGRQCWVENHMSLLQHNGDTYYYDKSTGRIYWSSSSVSLDSFTTIGYATLETMLSFKGVSNVTVSDLAITGLDALYYEGNVATDAGQSGMIEYYQADGTKVGAENQGLAAIFALNMTNFYIDGVSIYGVGGVGIDINETAKNVLIQNSKFTAIGSTAIRVGYGRQYNTLMFRDVSILNNHIEYVGEQVKSANGIYVRTCEDLKVMNNTVMNVPYTAIALGWGWSSGGPSLETMQNKEKDNYGSTTYYLANAEIAYNYITNFMTCMRDGGAIYTMNGNLTTEDPTLINSIHHNYIVVTDETGYHTGYGTNTDRWIMGIYHDAGSTAWYDYNNVMVNATTDATSPYDGAVAGMYPVYCQFVTEDKPGSSNAWNITLENNFFINFRDAVSVYSINQRTDKGTENIDADRNIVANDIIFSSIANLNSNTAVVGSTHANATSVEAPANSASIVAGIFAAAGSDLTAVKNSGGLTVTADAADTVLRDEVNDAKDTILSEDNVGEELPELPEIPDGPVEPDEPVGPTFVVGNLDGDENNVIDYNDLAYLLEYLNGLRSADTFAGSANLDGDAEGVVDYNDLAYLLEYLNGLRSADTFGK